MKIIEDKSDFRLIATYQKDGQELEIVIPYKVNPNDYSLNIKLTREALEDIMSIINTGTVK